MQGADVIVKGNTGNWTAQSMLGGTLTIMGDAKEYTGIDMQGGEIKAYGDLQVHPSCLAGRISHKGKLIFFK